MMDEHEIEIVDEGTEEEEEAQEESDEHVQPSVALPPPRARTAKQQASLKDEGDPTKTCTKCLQPKPLDAYSINNTKCKPCKYAAAALRHRK
jgi:hypothetical protein